MSRNPIAKALRSPHLHQRVITGNKRIDRMAAFADLQAQYLEALEADNDEALNSIEAEMAAFKGDDQ